MALALLAEVQLLVVILLLSEMILFAAVDERVGEEFKVRLLSLVILVSLKL